MTGARRSFPETQTAESIPLQTSRARPSSAQGHFWVEGMGMDGRIRNAGSV